MLNELGLDPSVLQLLFSQLNLNPADADALRSGDYARLLGERLAGDPTLAANPLLGVLMNGLQAAASSSEDEAWDTTEGDPRGPGHPSGAVIDAHAEPVVDEPADASDGAQALVALREVAGILGACACWGQDPGCPDCDGLGEPGYRPSSDADLFMRWMRPHLRRMRLRLVHCASTPRSSTTTTTKPEG